MISQATADDHAAAIGALTTATTTAEIAAALNGFTDLRRGARPGTAPGVPDGAPDGHYTNGYHFFTKCNGEIAATAINQLPESTLTLWDRLDEERRTQSQTQRLADEVETERRRRGRPGIGPAVTACIPPWIIAQLDDEAAEAGISRAQLIRDLIMEAHHARRQQVA